MNLRILPLLLLSTPSLAMENQTFVCSHDDRQRVIEVVYLGDGQVPCEVHYTKTSGTQTLWNANNEIGYCEEKAQAFVEQQRGWGWHCEQASMVITPEREATTTDDEMAAPTSPGDSEADAEDENAAADNGSALQETESLDTEALSDEVSQ